MAILVQFKDKTFDFVMNEELEGLIAANLIISFKRSSGWVDVGNAPLRKVPSGKPFQGAERRFQY